jgi:hypothetical protein
MVASKALQIKATTIQQSTMSPSKAKLPTRIAKDVRIKTKSKSNPRYGTVTEAMEKQTWQVQFDDGSSEVLKSNQLQIYKEYYNVPAATPVQKAASTIKRIVRKTVGRRRARKQPLADKSSNDSSSFESHQSDEEASIGSDDDEDYVPGGVEITDSPTDGVEVALLTPRPLSPSPRRPNRSLFNEEQASQHSDSSGHSFDDLSDDEEDDYFLTTALEDDGLDHCDFIDKPQKLRDYLKASKLMAEKKKELMGTTVTKTVKPTKSKYAIGGLVEGAPNTIKAGEKGTIIEECEDNIYLIEWDNDALPDSRVEKKNLQLQSGDSKTYVWKFVEDHVSENPPTEYNRHGVIGFSASGFHAEFGDDNYDHPFAKLVEQLWPGNWRDQISNLNKHIQLEEKSVKTVTDDEWWTYWGIIAFAAGAGVGGEEKLFDKKQKLFPELPKIDLSDHMKKYRFKQIKQVIPKAFVGNDESDPWNPINALIDGFNSARAQEIASSFCKVHDESMSAWKARTTKLGGLPFLSFVLRKPKPLGTEFKVTADTETGKCK